MKFMRWLAILIVISMILIVYGCGINTEEIKITFNYPRNLEVITNQNIQINLTIIGAKTSDTIKVLLNDSIIHLSKANKKSIVVDTLIVSKTNTLICVVERDGSIIKTNSIRFTFIKPTTLVKTEKKISYKTIKAKYIKKYEEIKPEIVLPEIEEVRESEYIYSVNLEVIDEKNLDYFKDNITITYNVELHKEYQPKALEYLKAIYLEIQNEVGQKLMSDTTKEPGATIEIDISSLPTGIYVFTVRAEDIKGKVYESSKWIKVDKTAPIAEIQGITNNIILRGNFEFLSKFRDEGVGLDNYYASISNERINFKKEKDNIIFSFDTTKFKNGKYEISIVATDKLGNTFKTNYSVIIDNWFEEIVDRNIGSGFNISSFLDSEDNIHIAYYNITSKNLYYGFLKKGSKNWVLEIVDKEVDTGKYPSIFVDRFNRIHISYTYINERWDDEDLRYAIKESKNWRISTLDQQDKSGRYTSIVVDSRGIPHISYYNYTVGSLRYITYNIQMNRWEVSVPDSYENVGSDTSIGIFDDTIHIVYLDNGNGDLRYCRKGIYETDAGWRFETVDSEGKVGYYASMKVDNQGNLHVAYYDSTTKALKYAIRSKGKWTTYLVDAKDDPGRFTSIFVDNEGKPHISYFVQSKREIRYAYYDGEKWNIQVVSSGKAGGYSSILVLDNKPLIFFYDAQSNNLKLAKK
ncbi:MAG: hypothetical protein N2712_02060 [Brevinematales bacterium]|nr:hypothetical protein [Brevinematales bacterium]